MGHGIDGGELTGVGKDDFTMMLIAARGKVPEAAIQKA
jgi:hypothetical protein